MILSKNKEKLLRKKLIAKELQDKHINFLYVNLMNDPFVDDVDKDQLTVFFLQKRQSRDSKTKIYRKCLLTSKARVMYKRFKVSRVKLKNMLDYGIVPGYKKAVW